MTHAEFVVGFHAGIVSCRVRGWRMLVARSVIHRALEDEAFFRAMHAQGVLRARAAFPIASAWLRFNQPLAARRA
jgi:hypothetical protein